MLDNDYRSKQTLKQSHIASEEDVFVVQRVYFIVNLQLTFTLYRKI